MLINPSENIAAGLGIGQTWQDMTASRAIDTIYTNTTGRSICVYACNLYDGVGIYGVVGGYALGPPIGFGDYAGYMSIEMSTIVFIVPPGAQYNIFRHTFDTIGTWKELR